MKQGYRDQYKLWCLLIAAFFSFHSLYGQGIKPANQNFGSSGTNNQSIRVSPLGQINYSVAIPGAPSSGTVYQFYGDPTGHSGNVFTNSNTAWYFNYALNTGTTAMYVPYAGQTPTGGCDYRMSFSTAGDTTQVLGNFKMLSMYLAIGAGNTSDVTVQGFRAGKMVTSFTINSLNSSTPVNFGDGVNINNATAADVDAGITINFGTNWTFLDEVIFLVPSGNIPLEVDNLVFDFPDDVGPGTQASSIGFTNTTGVSSQINWTSGGGDSVAVFIAAASSGTPVPATHSFYQSNSTFGSGDQISPSTGWYCVFRGKDAGSPSTSVYGLTPGTTYRTMAISYNGAFGWEDYNTGVGSNINNFTTIAIPSIQANNISVTPDFTDFKKATISWTDGNGASRAVFVRNNTSTTDATVAPLNNNFNADAQHHTYTAFTDSASIPLSSPARVGVSEWYCVFNGVGGGGSAASSVSMTGITVQPGQTLRVMVVEYNGTANSETYNTTSASNNVIDYFNPNFPLPVTNAATGISSSGATLNGSIDPRKANITNGSFVYSLSSSLSSTLGTITTLTPAATSITGSASPTNVAGTLTGLLPSTTYYYRLAATSNAGTLTATNGASNGIFSLTTAPVVGSVSATTANGFYKAGNLVAVTVVFTSAVTVTGTPALTLNSGGTASYASGTGTATLTFNYTVSGGENIADLDYTSTSALTLSGGTIKDAGNNDALLTLPTVGGASSLGGQKNIVIDTQTPGLTAVTIASDNPNTSLAKVGNIITINFTSSETIATPVVTVAGNTVTITNTGGNNWKATYTMATGDANGTVPFNISFSDLAGNAGTAVTATTNSSSVAFDKTLPTLTTVSIGSNNSNIALAKVGNTVTLNFTSSETITTPVVTVAGNTVTVTNTGVNNWTAVYTMASSDANGAVAFNISFSDFTGNTGTAVTTTTNSSSVTFDKTVPTLTAVSILSNNANTALAKIGNIVTISFTSSEAIATPVVTVAGNTATITNTGANNWTAIYTMASSDVNGTVSFSISFNDLAGNAGTTVTATTNSSSVTFDKTVPTLTAASIASNNANTALAKVGNIVTVSFTSSEGIATPVVTVAGNTATITNTGGNNWTAIYTMASSDANGTVSFSISFSDLAGNAGTTVTATTNSSSVTFDKTVPTLTAASIASNNANTALAKVGNIVTVSFTSSEGIATPVVTVAGNTATITNTGGNNWTAIYTMASSDVNGTVSFSISFSDLAGNAGTTVTATTNSSSVTFDKIVPTLTAVSIISNNANTALAKIGNIVTVSFTSSETIATPLITVAGNTTAITNTSANNWTAIYTMASGDANGAVSFSISFSDLAGNAGTTVTATTNSSGVTFDKTIPTLTTASILSNNANTALAKVGNIVTVSFTSSETIATPLVTVAGNTATITNTSANNWTAIYTMASGDTNGTVSFNISFNDLAGNAGIPVTATTNSSSVTFDKTAPTLSSVIIASDYSNTSFAKVGAVVTLNFVSSETIVVPVVTVAGNAVAVSNTGGNNWKAAYTMQTSDAAGVVTFNISFSDLAGNTGTTVTTTTNGSSVTFDKTAPTLSTVGIVSNNTNNSFAKTGDIITLSFTSSETIALPVVTVAGNTTAVTNTGSNNWKATYTTLSTDASGNIVFNIAFSDLAGNAGTTVTATTNNSHVLFDKTAPVINSINRQSPTTANPTGSSVVYRINFSEVVNGASTNSFQLTGTGTATASIISVSASSGATIDVNVDQATGVGTLRLDLKNSGTGITDSAGNAINGGFVSGQTYTFNIHIFFTTANPSLSLCQTPPQGSAPLSVSSLLAVTDSDNGATLNWTIVTAPLHGVLAGFPISVVSNGASTFASGLTYTPVPGYNGTDVFTIQASDGNSTITVPVTVTINALPVITINASQGTILCGTGATVPLSATGGNTYAWFNNNVSVPNVTSAQFTATAIGSYTVLGIDANGCAGTSAATTLTQLQKPTAAFVFNSYCINKPILFTNQSVVANSGAVTYAWDNGNNVTSQQASPVFTYTQQGNYTVKLTVSSVACPALTDNTTQPVSIDVPIAGIRMPTISVAINTQVTLTARAGSGYVWSPAAGLSSVNTQSVNATILSEQQYTVAVSAASGCVAMDTVLLRAFVQNDILLPNVFSPNNDGQNDRFIPNLVGITNFHYLRIFNRYGKKVYESANPAEGWDGKLNGVDQPIDTYNWIAEGVDKDGVLIKKQGAVTILR